MLWLMAGLAWLALASMVACSVMLPVAGFMLAWPWGVASLAFQGVLAAMIWRVHRPVPPVHPDGGE